jgi:DNA sulfur modification protein DndB
MLLKIEKVLLKSLGDQNYFYGSFASSKAKDITFVPVIEKSIKTSLNEITEKGYQRPGSMPRMNKFKQFLIANPRSVVPPVVLRGRNMWKFEPSTEDKSYGNLIVTSPAAIIDGQHRLGGYAALYESQSDDRQVDFVLIENLSLDEETQEFSIINNTQVGVPKSLTEFIAADNPLLNSKIGGEFIHLAWGLNTDQSSPFFGRITRTKMGPEHLFALHSVATELERMFSHGALVDLSREAKLEIIVKYWLLIQDAHSDMFDDVLKLGIPKEGRRAFKYKLLELTGLIAWSRIGYQILGGCYDLNLAQMNWDKVQTQIEYLSTKIDWTKDGIYKNATGLVGGPQIKVDMERFLAQMA